MTNVTMTANMVLLLEPIMDDNHANAVFTLERWSLCTVLYSMVIIPTLVLIKHNTIKENACLFDLCNLFGKMFFFSKQIYYSTCVYKTLSTLMHYSAVYLYSIYKVQKGLGIL